MSSIEALPHLTVRACAAGNDALLSLYRDYAQGRTAPATLLTGESGVGKKTLAHLMAQGLLCAGAGDKPCGQCRECRRYAARTHPNALFPAPAPREKTIKVEALRAAIDALSRHALEAGPRVIVIENAERMTPQAQNCLLKTLEETDADTYFFLTSDNETAVLPTIRSRCRVIRMQPWPRERIEELLRRRGIPPERARALSLYCEGSPGRALAMQEDESYWAARELVRKTFLSVGRAGDIPRAAALLRDQKDNGDRLLDILEQEIRMLLHSAVTGRAADEDVPPLFQAAEEKGLTAILESILSARRQKAANVGWAALAEGLMQTISEETSTWQL